MDEQVAASLAKTAREHRETGCALEIAQLLRDAFARSGHRQSDLAEALHLHKSQITMMLQGRRSPSLAEYRAICRFFGSADSSTMVAVLDTILQAGHWRDAALSGVDAPPYLVPPLASSSVPAVSQKAYRLDAAIGDFKKGDMIYCAEISAEPEVGDIYVYRVTRPDGLYHLYLGRFGRLRKSGVAAAVEASKRQALQGQPIASTQRAEKPTDWFDLRFSRPVEASNLGKPIARLIGFARRFS